MKTMSFTEFRKNASEAIDLVESGESIRILRHGKVVARLVPEQDHAQPLWKRPGLRLVIPGVSVSEAILDERHSDD